jgi:hypothetical protein
MRKFKTSGGEEQLEYNHVRHLIGKFTRTVSALLSDQFKRFVCVYPNTTDWNELIKLSCGSRGRRRENTTI